MASTIPPESSPTHSAKRACPAIFPLSRVLGLSSLSRAYARNEKRASEGKRRAEKKMTMDNGVVDGKYQRVHCRLSFHTSASLLFCVSSLWLL